MFKIIQRLSTKTVRIANKVPQLCLAIISLTTIMSLAFLYWACNGMPKNLTRSIVTLDDFLESPEYDKLDYNQLSYIYEPTSLCTPNDTIDVLFVVHSSVSNFERRQLLRGTIGKYARSFSSLSHKLLFVVGTRYGKFDMMSVVKEREAYNDILIVNIEDRYSHMTFKMVGWLKWTVKNCINVNFVFKMDDDAIVNTLVLDKFIRSCYESTGGGSCSRISCRAKYNEPVMRAYLDKNHLKRSEYPIEEFPVMCPGLAIIIPSPLLRPLLSATRQVPFVWLDDVFMTCILGGYIRTTINDISELYVISRNKADLFNMTTKMVGHLMSDSFAEDYKDIWGRIMKAV